MACEKIGLRAKHNFKRGARKRCWPGFCLSSGDRLDVRSDRRCRFGFVGRGHRGATVRSGGAVIFHGKRFRILGGKFSLDGPFEFAQFVDVDNMIRGRAFWLGWHVFRAVAGIRQPVRSRLFRGRLPVDWLPFRGQFGFIGLFGMVCGRCGLAWSWAAFATRRWGVLSVPVLIVCCSCVGSVCSFSV